MITRYLYHCPRNLSDETFVYRIKTRAGLRVAQEIVARHAGSQPGVARFVARYEAEGHCRANRLLARSNALAGLDPTVHSVGARWIESIDEGALAQEGATA